MLESAFTKQNLSTIHSLLLDRVCETQLATGATSSVAENANGGVGARHAAPAQRQPNALFLIAIFQHISWLAL